MNKIAKLIKNHLIGKQTVASNSLMQKITSKLEVSGYSPPFKISSIKEASIQSYEWSDDDNDALSFRQNYNEGDVADIISFSLSEIVSIREKDSGIGEYEHFGHTGTDKQKQYFPVPEDITINFSKLEEKNFIPYSIIVDNVEYEQIGTSTENNFTVAYYTGKVLSIND
jgi:hypothetical protein